jgi:hypothetical protein
MIKNICRNILRFGLALMLVAAPVAAQQGQDVGRRLSENYRTLRAYSWTMRTAVSIQGQQVSVTVDKMRYDLDGKLQETPLGGSGQLTPELQQFVDALANLAFSYTQPDPQKFSAFMTKAEEWEGKGAKAGTSRIEGGSFLQTGDWVAISAQNGRADQGKAMTSLNDAPVTIEAEYRAVPNDGPRYVARMVAEVPSEGLEMTVENFDYIKNAPVAAGDVTTLPDSTELKIRLVQPLSSDKSKAGQTFAATIDSDIVINKRTVIPRGSSVKGIVVDAEGSGKASGRAKMALKLTQVQVGGKSFVVETNTLSMEAEGTKGKDTKRILGGAGIGTVIGAIAGGGKGAAIGAAIGGGVGVGATLLTKGKEVELGAETKLSFKLMKPIQVSR